MKRESRNSIQIIYLGKFGVSVSDDAMIAWQWILVLDLSTNAMHVINALTDFLLTGSLSVVSYR